MNIRKLLSLVLCLALAVGLAVPALADAAKVEAAADQDLMAVTAKVKATLGLDTEGFDDFQGWADEDALLGKRWNLEWNGDGVSLSITADDNGKIYSYYRYESVSANTVAEERGFGGRMSIPRLPQDKSKAAHETAQAFLNKVLESGLESVTLENNYAPSLWQDTYRYSGTIQLNGLDSPIKCSVFVRASDLTVTRFWRGDQSTGYLNGVPAVAQTVTQAQARRDLQTTVELEAKFVRADDGKTAVVRYVPVYGDAYYVDGATGKLVNLTELYEKLWRSGSTNDKLMYTEAAADMAAGAAYREDGGLTQAEKDGAAILAGALSKEDLNRAVQNAWPELGLDKYTLAGASYSIREKAIDEGAQRTSEDYDVTCSLTYGRQDGQLLRNKYITVDAKTGALQEVWSRRYWQGEEKDTIRYAATLSSAQATADKVLASFAGANYGVLALKDSADAMKKETWEHTFTYQQKAGDWFYDGNSYTVAVDATDGTISRLWGTFDEDITLVVPKSIVSPSEAAKAYAEAMDVPFIYLEVPVSISLASSDIMPLLKNAGYSYVLALKTGYTLTQPKDSYVRGVDAESGVAVVDKGFEPDVDVLTYADLEGHWVKTAAEALAVFGIGLRGGELKPGDALTQLDMIALLCSVDGYSYDPATASQDDTDWLYHRAYTLGLVTPETRNPDKAITRGELVKLILDAAGYARIAALKGIFRCDFADSAAIPEGQMGYAALAQGLGLVKGGSDGSFAGERTATRAEAVAMLYQYMK